MDIILEFLLEIILEGTFELGTSKKVCLPIRILLLLICLLIYGTVIGVIVLVGVGLWQEGSRPLSLMVFGLAAALALLVVYKLVKQYRKNRGSGKEEQGME